jgi:cell division protein FtsI (penicillin-binding protein 3)
MLVKFFRNTLAGRPGADAAGVEARDAVARSVKLAPDGLDPPCAADELDEGFEARWRGNVKRRIIVILAVLGLWTTAVEAHLAYYQIFRHEQMLAHANAQQQNVISLTPQRGDIVDRHGQLLAYSVEGSAVVADPSAVNDAADTASKVCGALGNCDAEKKAAIVKSLNRQSYFAWLDRQVSPEQARRVEDLKLPGVRVVPQPRRYYPKFELAAHVLGFVGVFNEGLGGIERAYDSVIRGREGRMLLEVDARRKRRDSRIQEAPEPGATVELTLDLYLQHIAERELRAGVEVNHAVGGTAIVMDPRNGDILALASYPTFNPNAVQKFSDDDKRNRAIQDVYEPGSTFKIVTASAAFEEGVLKIDDVIDTSPGVITFPGRKPITEDKHHNYGVLSVEDVIVRSSNIGAIKIGMRVGSERMGRYIQRFGFGQALLPDLGGQSHGIVWDPVKLSESALASMSMGYQVSVTPLQMATAVSVVANGGTLFEPHLVRGIITDEKRQPIPAKPLRRVISTDTAATLTTIMEGVVERGTGDTARLDSYQVAGKTGTAAKLVNHAYSTTEYNVSFVGFVPSRQPMFTIVVVVDTPRNGSPYGRTVAAPIFKRIADAALRQLAVSPTINPPPVIMASDAAAAAQHVSAPVPETIEPLGGQVLMPDVRGLGARDALRVLTGVGLAVRVSGSGIVAAQTPEPGEPIEGGWSVLQLRRTPTAGGGR